MPTYCSLCLGDPVDQIWSRLETQVMCCGALCPFHVVWLDPNQVEAHIKSGVFYADAKVIYNTSPLLKCSPLVVDSYDTLLVQF
jgi:hypothetical protein